MHWRIGLGCRRRMFGSALGPWILGLSTLLLGALMSWCEPAQAQDSGGVYIGGNFARARDSYDTGFLDRQFESEASQSGESLAISNRSVDRYDWVWWADAGYLFTPYIGLEAEYLHLGELRYQSTGSLDVGGTQDPTSTSAELASRGPALSLVGRLPLTPSFEVDLRLGDYFGKTTFYDRVTVAAQSVVFTTSKTNSSLLAVVGAAYTFAGHYSVRLDYMRVNNTGDSAAGGKFSVNLASAGVSYTF